MILCGYVNAADIAIPLENDGEGRPAPTGRALTNDLCSQYFKANIMAERVIHVCNKTAILFAVWFLVTVLTPVISDAAPRDPFPLGYSMMSQGALVEAEGVSARQPWTPAAHYRDSLRWGASAAVVSYHGGGSAARYAAGGFGTFGPVAFKGALTHLDVMGLYFEQTAALSAGSRWRFLSYSLEATNYRSGLTFSSADRRSATSAGAALLAVSRVVSAGATVEGLTLLSGGARDADPSPVISLRVCTVRNKYGSQGAMVTFTPNDDAPIRFVIAQEYRIGNMFALSASIASNPTMIGFGLTVDKKPASATAAAVNHPQLGWSRGMSVDYAR